MTLLHLKREWIYGIIGVVSAMVLLWYLVATLGFLLRELGRALNQNLIKTPEVVRFNLDKMKELKIPGVE